MRFVIDTHVFLWWTGNLPGLSKTQSRALDAASADEEPVGLAAVSLWEIAQLVARRRIRVAEDDIRRLIGHPALAVLPLTTAVAFESTKLGRTMTKDPADQIIVATARVHGVKLMTSDDRIRRARVVDVI